MNQTSKRVVLTLKTNTEVAKEVAYAVLMRANPHDSDLVERKLTEADITLENLTRYFTEITKAVAQFWNNQWDVRAEMTMKPHELRGLYLPTIYAVIFASLGNCKVGNYEYIIQATANGLPDRDWLISFSAKLESMRSYVRGYTGQIGNRSVQPQTQVMLCIIADGEEQPVRATTVYVRDGVTVDNAQAGLAALAGISLVENALQIMYTGEIEVPFRQVVDGLIEKGLIDSRKPLTGFEN